MSSAMFIVEICWLLVAKLTESEYLRLSGYQCGMSIVVNALNFAVVIPDEFELI